MAAAKNGMERWRGEVSARLDDISRRLEDHKIAVDALGNRFTAVEKAQASVIVRLAAYGIVGGAVVSAVVQVMARKMMGV